MNKGIALVGYTGVDILKTITEFPERHNLVTVLDVSLTLGGLVSNCARDLARLDPTLPIKAVALVGTDGYGDEVINGLSAFPNIDVSHIRREGMTATTDVLAEAETKVRTFLTYRGASAKFDESYIDFDALECDIFHAGYVLLLDALDAPDEEYGTKMARLLKHAQDRGIKTSVDVITDASGRHKVLLPPAMKYTDYTCINEHEAAAAFDIPLRDENDDLILENMPVALRKFKELGVKRWAVIHAPEGGFGIDENDEYYAVPGYVPPEGFIAGTVGAGDAFVSGVLLGAYYGKSLPEAIEDGIIAAVCSLNGSGASDAVLPLEEARALVTKMERRVL